MSYSQQVALVKAQLERLDRLLADADAAACTWLVVVGHYEVQLCRGVDAGHDWLRRDVGGWWLTHAPFHRQLPPGVLRRQPR